MSKKSSTMTSANSKANLIVYAVVIIVLVVLGIKYLGPKTGIEAFKSDSSNNLEYAHAEGFPKNINVGEEINKTRLVIKSEEELKKAIEAVDKNKELKIPEINFSKKMALFVSSKTRAGGGYETRIKKIYVDKDDLVVEIRDTEPGSTCINTQQMNLPVDLVVVDKFDHDIEWIVQRNIVQCN